MTCKDKGDLELRIADFGLAIKQQPANAANKDDIQNQLGSSMRDENLCGTPGYIAPEAFNRKGYTGKADIFGLGSLLFSLLTHQNLFSA